VGVSRCPPAFPFDLTTALLYGRLWADIVRKGVSLGAHDLMIASMCIVLRFSVFALNIRDYEKIPGLRIVRA
jgi:predicted nucleic acid-binding protein